MPKWSFAFAWIAIGYYLWNLGGDIFALIPEFQLETLWRSYRSLTFVLYVITAGLVWVSGLLHGLGVWSSPLRLAKQVLIAAQDVLEKLPKWLRKIFAGFLMVLPTWPLLFSSFAYETVGIYLRLFFRIGDANNPFPEENDAWVTWVSLPLLQNYRIWKDFKIVGIQLLVPRE